MSGADLPGLPHKVWQTEQEGCSSDWRNCNGPQTHHQGVTWFSLLINTPGVELESQQQVSRAWSPVMVEERMVESVF